MRQSRQQKGGKSKNTGTDTHSVATSPEEAREKMIAISKEHLKATKNTPTTMRHLAQIVSEKGVHINGKNPGTTLGAILMRLNDFELVDKTKRLWRLRA